MSHNENCSNQDINIPETHIIDKNQAVINLNDESIFFELLD